MYLCQKVYQILWEILEENTQNSNYKNKTSHIKMFEKYFKAIYQYKQELIIIVQMGRVDR